MTSSAQRPLTADELKEVREACRLLSLEGRHYYAIKRYINAFGRQDDVLFGATIIAAIYHAEAFILETDRPDGPDRGIITITAAGKIVLSDQGSIQVFRSPDPSDDERPILELITGRVDQAYHGELVVSLARLGRHPRTWKGDEE